MRKFLIAAAILIALVVGAVMIGPNFVNWNAYKTDIAAQLTAATGRDIAIDGELSLAMLPSPRLLATGVRLTAPDGSEFEELLRLRELEVHVALAPLIEQRLQISSIVLVEPEIMLQRLADGRVNWVEGPCPRVGWRRQSGSARCPVRKCAVAKRNRHLSRRGVRCDGTTGKPGRYIRRRLAAWSDARGAARRLCVTRRSSSKWAWANGLRIAACR